MSRKFLQNLILEANHGKETHSAKTGTIVWPKIPKMPKSISLAFSEKSSLWVSVRGCDGVKDEKSFNWVPLEV